MHALSTIAQINAELEADPSLLAQAREILAVRADPKNGRNPGTQARSQAWLDAHPVEVKAARKVTRTRKVTPETTPETTAKSPTRKARAPKPGSQAWIAQYREQARKDANATMQATIKVAGVSAGFKARKAYLAAAEAVLAEQLAG